MTEIKIIKVGKCVETLRIKSTPNKFILYRGKLLEKVSNPTNESQHLYEERTYLEIY